MGWIYILFPAILSSTIFVTLGFLLNNISSLDKRKYPVHWLPDFSVARHAETASARNESHEKSSAIELGVHTQESNENRI